ncbi:microfibril-associated glycoprotein 4-like [Conger conger]|uniref:microfibril-associated glycoprotein 4-like n=1 Tax=Conger conger TaxID=82655 RepID=UPI002A5A8721|nr:microfibril-associated glycoprotein 4-like [Conger conger]
MLEVKAEMMTKVEAGMMMDVEVGMMMEVGAETMMDVEAGMMMEVEVGMMMDVEVGMMMDVEVGMMMEVGAETMMEVGAETMMEVGAETMMEVEAGMMMEVEPGMMMEVQMKAKSELEVEVESVLEVEAEYKAYSTHRERRGIEVSVLLHVLLPVTALSVPVVHKILPLNCEDIYRNGSTHSGVYAIYPGGDTKPVQVYCDMGCEDDNEVDRGMWTVIQRRMDGTVNFYRPWNQYKTGFGDPAGEYWLGLENIFLLTWTKKYELRVDMEDFERGRVHAQYSSFSIDPESEGYKLHISTYIDGGAGDSLAYHNEKKFSTFDKDQDAWSSNCALTHHGGFWFDRCLHANPNGLYTWGQRVRSVANVGVLWQTWKGTLYSMKSISMKIRSLSLERLEE